MKNKIKNELEALTERLYGRKDFDSAWLVFQAIMLIKRLESALDRAEHKRKENASQVKVLTKKVKSANKGLRTITKKPSPALQTFKIVNETDKPAVIEGSDWVQLAGTYQARGWEKVEGGNKITLTDEESENIKLGIKNAVQLDFSYPKGDTKFEYDKDSAVLTHGEKVFDLGYSWGNEHYHTDVVDGAMLELVEYLNNL